MSHVKIFVKTRNLRKRKRKRKKRKINKRKNNLNVMTTTSTRPAHLPLMMMRRIFRLCNNSKKDQFTIF
jgi:hypothetical protein